MIAHARKNELKNVNIDVTLCLVLSNQETVVITACTVSRQCVIMLVVLFHRYLDAIERAVANGDCVLIENMGENMDPVLDPLVGRNTIKKGRYVSF